MKKTFLIFLVLLCVASMAVTSVAAASDDMASADADTSLTLTDNAIESISSADGDISISNAADVSSPAAAVSDLTDDKSLGEDSLEKETNVSSAVDVSQEEISEANSLKATSKLGDGEGSGNIIYVSTTGSDENDGSSQATAVATFAKAMELAAASTGTDLTIFVASGEYNSVSIESPEAKNINLIGEDRDSVILHLSGTYGINVYQDDVNWTIENLTLCDLVSTAGRSTAVQFAADGASLYVNNVVIRDIASKYGAFSIQSENGRVYVSNTTIKDIHANVASSAVVYVTGGSADISFDNVEITGFDLSETFASATTYARCLIYGYSAGSTINIINSRIVNNSAPMYSFIESKTPINIINTTIADNYAQTSENGNAGGQYFFWTGTSSSSASAFKISQSTIVNNMLGKSGYGLFTSTYGNHIIEYSVIMDNTYANGDAIPSIRTSGGTVNADYNYWGSNDAPSDVSVNNWVILTAETPEYAFVNVPDAIVFYLNTYNTTSGTTGSLEKTVGELNLALTYALNSANPSSVIIKDGVGTVDYLATEDGSETVTLSTGDAFSFEVNADASSLIYVDGSVETSGDGSMENPFKTIAEALNVAADGKIIMIRSGTYTEKDLVIDDEISVKAERGANVIIDANDEGRIFTVTSTATLKDLTLINGQTTADGGAIYLNGGSLTLNNVKIYNSTALNGGAIADTAASNLIVSASEFIDNIATNGGAIYVAGTANITESKFVSNDPDNGGAIYVAGTANIESNEFTANEADNGGAIYIDSANPQTIKKNTFASNVAGHNEAIYIKNAAVDWSENTLGENEVIFLESGSIKSALTFLGGNTVTADFGQTIDLTATLTDDQGNAIRGGVVTFTANGVSIGTVDLSGDNELKTSYTAPLAADSDVTISGSYSLDNAGTVVDGTVHLAIPKWFIEGGNGYETLAEAVAAAQDGDVIYGVPGTYVVNGITVGKNITIKANETGSIILDGDNTRMFTVNSGAKLRLVNLDLTKGGRSGGGFVYLSGANAELINSTFRDLSASSASGAISVVSGSNLTIEGSKFENINSTSGSAILSATTATSLINIKDSSFNNIIQNAADHTLMQIGGTLNIERSNFTNVEGKYQSNWYGGIGATSNGNIFVSDSRFINMTGGDGAAIYFNSGGNLTVIKSVFMNTKAYRGAIYVNNQNNADINYNLFINNTGSGSDAKAIYKNNANLKLNASYNFWGNNSQPTTSQISKVEDAQYWTIVELSSSSDTVYVGTTADIIAQFVGTDGTENLTLEGIMPEYDFELTASAGSIDPTAVSIVDNLASATYTPPASEGTVTITASPGPSELVLNVMDPSALLVVSTDGSNSNPGTLDSPYATIEYALSQVTETRNIIYLLNKGEDYTESGLTVSGNVIIRGEDETVTIDGENSGRIFTVTGTLTLENVVLTGGMTNDAGGAILVNGANLTLSNVNIADCGAGTGGAIATTAGSNLSVSNSLFSSNIAMYGGAIYVGGEAAIADSEFFNHEYATYGGAIYVNTSSDVSISGNTFEGNDADKGEAIYIKDATVNLTENTMLDSESIYLESGSVNSVLIFLNTETINVETGETVTLNATLTDDQGNSIRGGSVTFTANGETIATVDISGSNPLTTTYTVPADADDDIIISGSYSLDNGGIVGKGILHPTVPYWFIEGKGGYETLSQAIDAAVSGDVIYYDKTAEYTEVLNGKTIDKKLVIKNNGTGTVTIDAGKTQIFVVSDDLELNNLNFINGSNTQGGFISQTGGTLKIIDSSFKDTDATSNNGAVLYTSSGNIYIEGSIFDNLNTKIAFYQNSASGSFTVINSSFNNINGTYDGWTIYSKSPLSIANSNFTNLVSSRATSSSYYGAIYSSKDTKITESRFTNITGPTGAAVYVTGDLNITKSVFDTVNTQFNVIYASGTRNINYNIFLNSGKAISGSSGNVDYNYWGTNDNPGTDVSGVSLNNWVIMTVSPASVESLIPGQTQDFTVDFTHYTDGTANYTMADTIPELTISASAVNGQLDAEEKETTNNQAVFTYTMGDYSADTITFVNAGVSIPVTISTVEPYTGIIYVAKDGDDTNDGSEEAPVATIAKAVELAQGNSGQIIINEGTYTENGIVINDDVAISTVGEVVLNGNGARYFDIKDGDVSIANLTMTNCNNTYGGAVIRITGGSLSIADSVIANNGGEYRDNLIRVSTASLNLTNVLFENNTAHKTSTNYGGVYVSDGVLIVDGCTFKDNFNKYGQIYVGGSSIGSYAIINNTLFIGNNATSSSGGAGAGIYASGTAAYQYSNGTVRPGAPSTVYVVDCEFINNSAKGGTYYAGQGGAIYVNNNVSLYVSGSTFINNTCVDNTNGTVSSQGGAIFASAGNLYITQSIFDGNVASEGSYIYMKAYGPDTVTLNCLNITNSAIFGNGTNLIVSNYSNGSVVANNNYWGSNDYPEGKVNENVTLDTWVIMNVEPISVTLTEASDVEITVDFKHTNSTDGSIAELEGKLPIEFSVKATTDTGSLNASTIETVDGVGKVTFTPNESGESVAYIILGNDQVPVYVNVSGPYDGPIYVSLNGSDENPGSPEAPVATIAKAVELANAGSGAVIITEGTYYESNITLDKEKSINITGEGNVLIDGGESTDSIFYMHGGEAKFTNIAFTGDKANYGGAIRINNARGGTNRNIIDINLTVDNCTFTDMGASSRGGAIYAFYTKGNMVIKDSEFSGMNTSGWGGAVCVGYSAYEDHLNFEVVNSSFHDNRANNGGALYVYADTISIKDSSFYNNNASYSPGAMYLYNTTAFIDNCTIYDNHAISNTVAAAIEIEAVSKQPIATLTITNSVIENNTGLAGKAPAINVDKATLDVSYSSLVNELSINTVTATGYDAIYGQGIAIANNNWWGTNDPATAINGTNYTIDKWVIMNVEANATDVVAGDEVKVTVDFNHVNTTAGEIEELTGGVIPKETYTVNFAVENGTIAPETLEVANGAIGEAIFTANNDFALITITSDNAVENITFIGEIPEPYTGIVYVSKDGDDANNGSEDTPVATIAKAIEIATGEFGSGQIIVKEGTYAGCGYVIDRDLSIVGDGEVILDGEGQGTLFRTYGSGVEKLTLANLTLQGATGGYGAVVYSDAQETVLDNVKIMNNPGAGDLITTYHNLTIKDSLISGHDGGDVIQSSGDATIIINNTLFENNVVNASTADFGIVYITGNKVNLIVEDSQFINNTARQGVLIGSTNTDITVKGTDFIDNDNSVAYGGVIRALSKLDVTDSVFINNKAGREGGAIYIGTSGEANITKSAFINNTCGHYDSDYNGDVISTYGKLNINYCVILPAEGTTKALIFNRNGDNTPNAQYNWWGTNDNPSYLVAGESSYDPWEEEEIECPAPDVSNWIIMNVEADIEDVEAGAAIPIKVDFNHYIDANGEVQELADSLAQELLVSFISETGSFDNTEVTTVDQVATATYTVADGVNNITVKSANASVNIDFDISPVLIETTLTVSAENAVAGELAVINVTLVDADGVGINGTVVVSVNGEDKDVVVTDGVGSLELTGLKADTYPISAKFNATDKYAESTATGSLLVIPKETTLAITAESTVAGELAVINVTLVDADGVGINGTVVVTVNGEDKDVVVSDGVGSLELTGLKADTYPISAKFNATDKYAESTATGSLLVIPKETTLAITAESTVAGELAVINVTLVDADGVGINGTVVVTVNGEDKDVVVSDGVGSLELTGLKADTYPISAKFNATDYYKESTATGSLVVNPKEVKFDIVVDDVVIGESSNITARLTDSEGNPLNGTVNVSVNGKDYPITVVDGKGSVSTDAFEELGTVDVVAKYDGDDYTAPSEINSSITVYGPGNVTVKHTDAGDAKDIQAAIDAANPGDIVQLGNYDYSDVADVNITKPVTLAGTEGTNITSTGDGTPIFNVPAISEDGPESANITGISFKLNNADTVVKATADNDTNPLSIVTPNISISGNTFETANDDVVPESVHILELDSERGVLSPTGEISISDNTIAAGVDPFKFEVTSVNSGSDVNVEPQNFTPERKATEIIYNDMNTTAVSPLDPNSGEWFTWRLVDSDGNPVANTPMKIGFNGVIYDEKNGMVTDENGYAKLQINLGYKGDYTFAISFLGNDEYNASFVVAKIKVATQTGSLAVPNKSYAASAKTKALTATFKTKSGKVIANKKISFTVNGKTYTAKTNAKGVATVNVSLNKKGTYNFVAKFAGDSTYTAITKKAKLVIK